MRFLTLSFFFTFLVLNAFSQPVYNDGAIEYSVSVVGSDLNTNEYFKNIIMKFYLRGTQTRSELYTSIGNTVTIHDNQTGSAVLLNDYGSQKIMVRMNADQYKQANKIYENPIIETTTDVKIISGYKCVLNIVKFSDGKVFNIYTSSDLRFQNNYYGIPVKLNGFPLEYESEIGGVRVVYKATSVNTNPLPAGIFDTPTSGYREMKFEEMKK
jgi:hypothetical protein